MTTKERIAEISKWIDEQVGMIDNIPDEYFKMILYFSLIESFAQETINYKKNQSTEGFTSFILKYCKSIDFLSRVDPITLYYDCYDELKDKIDINDYFSDCSVYKPGDATVKRFESVVLNALPDGDVKGKQIKKHRYVNLLYGLRSKLVHEMSAPGLISRKEEINKWADGFEYNSCSRYVYGNLTDYDDVWELVIPASIIRTILLETVSNYLEECDQNNTEPFKNNIPTRKYILSWYD